MSVDAAAAAGGGAPVPEEPPVPQEGGKAPDAAAAPAPVGEGMSADLGAQNSAVPVDSPAPPSVETPPPTPAQSEAAPPAPPDESVGDIVARGFTEAGAEFGSAADKVSAGAGQLVDASKDVGGALWEVGRAGVRGWRGDHAGALNALGNAAGRLGGALGSGADAVRSFGGAVVDAIQGGGEVEGIFEDLAAKGARQVLREQEGSSSSAASAGPGGNPGQDDLPTGIVATVNPATSGNEAELIREGVDTFHFPTSRLEPSDLDRGIHDVRAAADAAGHNVGVMVESQAGKIRIGDVALGRVQRDQLLILDTQRRTPGVLDDRLPAPGDPQVARIGVPDYPQLVDAVQVGDILTFGETGELQAEVKQIGERSITSLVTKEGPLNGGAELKLPGGRSYPAPPVTDRDREFLRIAARQRVDAVAVPTAGLEQVAQFMRENGAGGTRILANIENPEDVRNAPQIARTYGGLVLKRKSVGSSAGMDILPEQQNQTVAAGKAAHKPIYLADEVLGGMAVQRQPPAAEAVDLANATHEGFTSVVLSPEGPDPVATVLAAKALIKANAVDDSPPSGSARPPVNVMATVHPSGSFTQQQAAQWLDGGVNTFRFDAQGLSWPDLRDGVDNIRAAQAEILAKSGAAPPADIMLDLDTKARIADVFDGRLQLQPDDDLMLNRGIDVLDPRAFGAARQVEIRQHPELLANVAEGDVLAFDDGQVQVKVTDVDPAAIQTKVLRGGSLYGGEDVKRTPGRWVSPVLSQEEEALIGSAADLGVNSIAVAALQHDALDALRDNLEHSGRGRMRIFAKIENGMDMEEMPSLAPAYDGFKVERDDLGYDLGMDALPAAQNYIPMAVVEAGADKPVIVAGEVLDAMAYGERPSAAEAVSVADAVRHGIGGFELSRETSPLARDPAAAIRMLHAIAKHAR